VRRGRRAGIDARSEPDASEASPPSAAFLALARRPRRDLEEALLRGAMPELAQLAGWEFRGMNTPAWARLARIRKFVKGFERREGVEGSQVFGYNRKVAQNRDERPWRVAGAPFGWFRVGPVDATDRDNAYLHAALLDYGRGGNRSWDPSRGLRDYLVQVDGANPDLYLGKAYYAIGPARAAVSFFVLERMRRAAG
jgi:hypothetical protein